MPAVQNLGRARGTVDGNNFASKFEPKCNKIELKKTSKHVKNPKIGLPFSEKVQNFPKASERFRTRPDAPECIRTHPNRSEQVRKHPKTSKNLRRHRKPLRKLRKFSRKLRNYLRHQQIGPGGNGVAKYLVSIVLNTFPRVSPPKPKISSTTRRPKIRPTFRPPHGQNLDCGAARSATLRRAARPGAAKTTKY